MPSKELECMSSQDAKSLHSDLRIYGWARVLTQLIVVQLPTRTSTLRIASTEHLQICVHSLNQKAFMSSTSVY